MTTTPPPPWHPEGPLPPPQSSPPIYPDDEPAYFAVPESPPVGQPYSGHVPNLGGHGAHTRRRRRRWPWVLAGFIAGTLLLVALAAGLAVVFGATAPEKEDGVRPLASVSPSPVTAKAPAPIPPSEYQPRPEDFTLAIKVLDKQCFGSAGCNIQYRVDFAEIDSRVPDDASFEVTYVVKGGEDEAVGTIAVDGGQYSAPEDIASTKSAAKKLTVTVTSVEEA